MDAEQWQKIREIFDVALKREPSERAAYLAEVCDGQTDLRREVESLLSSYNNAGSFLEKPLTGGEDFTETKQPRVANGAIFGHYEILKPIGAGGMGEVYLARDKKLDRLVAVKILNEKISRDASNLRRFTQEARAASALNNPNILVIHEIGESGDAPYLVSEYVEGETLREILNREILKLAEVLDISIQIAGALAAAHHAKIIHRDIKPENIIVRPDGLVKILDFGLAKLVAEKLIGADETTIKQNNTAKGLILGTLNYMSPEQAKGAPIDERTDIFSFGAVLYEMLTGRTPFAGESAPETLANLMNDEPPPLVRFSSNDSEELQRIVSKTLRKKPDERYQTMKDLLADLKHLRQELEFQNKFERAHPPTRGEAVTQSLSQAAANAPTTGEKTADGKIKRFAPAIGLSVVLLLLAVGFGVWYFANRVSDAKQIESIAVLPFENDSGNADVEYLSDGMTETLIGSLSQLPKLNVKPRSSVFRYKSSDIGTKQIGEQLSVQAILTGRFVQRGDDLTLFLSLVDAAKETNLWSKQYNRKLTNLVALQTEIARDVSDNLKTKLSGAEKQKLIKNSTENPEAYQLYLKGRYQTIKLSPQEILKGVSYLQEAIQIDPNYALAHVGLADAYRSLALGGEQPPNEYFPKAKAAANRAIEIDDALGEAHAVLGFIVSWYDWDWTTAEKHLKRALELNPNNSDAHLAYGHVLSTLGRFDEGLAELKQARESEPLNVRTTSLEARFLANAGRRDESFAAFRKIFETDPNYWFAYSQLAITYVNEKMYTEAAAAARRASELNNYSSQAIALEGYALAKSGRRAEARAVLQELLGLSKQRNVPPTNFAMVHCGLDEKDEAVAWLERAYRDKDPRITFLKIDRLWDDLRGDSRFQEIVRRLGLPQ